MGAAEEDRALRVLHVTPYFAPAFCYGGPPRSILGLCRGLQRAGVEIEVFTTAANGPAELPTSPPEGERYDGVPVRYFARAFPRRAFGAIGLGAALAEKIGGYDLLHAHGLWNAPSWTAARHARRLGVPYALSPRGMLQAGSMARHRRRKRLGYWVRERRNLAEAAFLHATSRAEADTLGRRRLGVPIVTVPNGVETGRANSGTRGAFRQARGLPRDVPLIAFLGRVHQIKRLDLLAAAYHRVRVAHPDARLVVAGPDERDYRRRVEPCFAEDSGMVHWAGEVDEADKWALLADADALVMCSDSESFGMSVVEALAAGVPVVVTRTCPWQEIESAGCGFWVPQDAAAIASALEELIRDPAVAGQMGERGRALALARYSWDSIAHAMADAYRSALSSERPRPRQ